MNAKFQNTLKNNKNGVTLKVITTIEYGEVKVLFEVRHFIPKIIKHTEKFKDLTKALDFYYKITEG